MAETATVAMLVEPGKFEFREYPIPAIGDDEMLIKVEGCGVCGTDGHEYKRDPFGLCAKGVVLGHEGSGEIVKIGKNVKTDSHGREVKLGDKIVTCIIPCGECPACKNTPARTSLCENCGVYGLFPDDDVHLNGYFGTYMVIRKGSTFFNVTGMTLDQRMLIEPAAVAVHAVERAKTTGLLNFNTKVLVQGCGPIGLMVLAVLRTLGIDKIIAVDGNDNRLELAKEMGATATFNFTKYASFDDMLAEIRKESDGLGAGFVFGLFCLYDFFRYTLRNSDIVKAELDLPTIGMIGTCSEKQNANLACLTEKSDSYCFNHILEDFLLLQTNLQYSLPKKNRAQILVLTSAFPKDGKSFTSLNLALTLCGNSKRVLLINCDLRKAEYDYLDLPRQPGLVNFLLGEKKIDEVIHKNVLGTPLSVIRSGPIPPNPTRLLEIFQTSGILDELVRQNVEEDDTIKIGEYEFDYVY